MAQGAEFYTYPWDLSDEGVAAASGVIADTVGPGGGVLLALSYHVSTYFSPHNPVRKLYYGEEGAVYFVPDERLYTDRPLVSDVVSGRQYMSDMVRDIQAAQLSFSVWAVYFYNHHLPQAYPRAAKRDCFGQPYLAQLCPANPQVRAYALALTRDMVSYGPRSVQLESLGYLPFAYGFRNPKVVVKIAPFHEFLMGLCFCEHCTSAATTAGVDGESLRGDVAAHLETELRLEPTAELLEADREELIQGAFDGRLLAYLEARVDTATSLFEEVAAVVRGGGAGVTFFGSLDRRVTGLDRQRVLGCLDAVYTTVPGPPEQAAQRVGTLRDELPGARLVAIVRPGGAGTEQDVRSQIDAQADAGVDGFAFYTYGLVREQHLDWIRSARGAWS
jgi:hypothetical protein